MNPRTRYLLWAGAAVLIIAGIAISLLLALTSHQNVNRRGGIVVLRHEPSSRTDEAHHGILSIGADRCLYVTTEGATYWASLGPGYLIAENGLTSPDGTTLPYNAEVMFAREGAGAVPSDYAEQCSGAHSAYGIGF